MGGVILHSGATAEEQNDLKMITSVSVEPQSQENNVLNM